MEKAVKRKNCKNWKVPNIKRLFFNVDIVLTEIYVPTYDGQDLFVTVFRTKKSLAQVLSLSGPPENNQPRVSHFVP